MIRVTEKFELMIVVDMQNDFVSGSLGSEMARAVVPNVVAAVDRFISMGREAGLIFTKDVHKENYPETNEGRHLPVRHCISGTWGCEIVPELEGYLSHEDVTVVEKAAFGAASLPELVREKITEHERGQGCCHIAESDITFHVMGLCTDICVICNALLLKTHFPEAVINLDSSCCAGVTPESHRAALDTMKMCQIEIF